MTALAGIVSTADVARQLGMSGPDDDLWLAGAVASVSDAIEAPAVTGRWFRSRGATSYLFDGNRASRDGTELYVPMGVQAITYLGVSSTDQPDTGLGTYTEITSGYYLDPPIQSRVTGDPAFSITLGTTAALTFPTTGRRCIKVTGSWGYAAVPARVAQIATAAIVRAFRAKSSGGADYAIVGPDGGMRILRDFAPAELEELRATYRVPVVA